MATVTVRRRFKFGNGFGTVCDVAMSNSYPTGGEPITPAELGLGRVDFVLPSTAASYMFEFDHTNSKLKAIHPRAAIANTLAASVNAGATTVTSTAANGAIVALSGVAGVAAGAGAEVANATNLSAVTVRVIAIGT